MGDMIKSMSSFSDLILTGIEYEYTNTPKILVSKSKKIILSPEF